MATLLTINTTPDAVNAAYREIKWSATSTDANIKAVICDVYINGAYSSTINGVRILGTTDQFTFDIRKIMQSVLVSELRTDITSFAVSSADLSSKNVKIRLFEVVESGGVFTSTWAANGAGTNYLESSTYAVSNTATQHLEDFTDWTAESVKKKLLTMSLNNKRIPRGVPFQIGFIGTGASYSADYETFDVDNNSLGTTVSGLPVALTSKKGIIEIPASAFASSNVAYIEVLLRNTGGSVMSEKYRFKITDDCNLFPLFFQNHLGDFDHFNFGAKKVVNINTTNQRMSKPLPSGFSSEDAGTTIVSSRVSEKIEVYCASLSANELVFLQELIKNHSVVYKWEESGVFLSYVITSHSTKVEDNDGLINTIKITLQPSNQHIVQNGD